MPHGVLADGEEQGLGALIRECLEDRRGVAGPWAVVEGQHHLVFAQEIVGLELLEAEAGPAGGIDLHNAGDAERIRIPAGWTRRSGDIGTVERRECNGARGRLKRDRRRRRRLRLRRRGDRMRSDCAGHQSRLGDLRRHGGRGWLPDRERPTKCKADHPTTTATAMAPAVAKNAILRITLFPPKRKSYPACLTVTISRN